MERELSPEIKKQNQFEFIYTVDSEINYLRDLAPQIKSLINRNYEVALPEGVSLEKVIEFDEPTVRNSVEKELDPDSAQKYTEDLKAELEPLEKKLDEFINSLPGEKPERLRILWTNYGPGGSYGKPGVVRLRFDACVPTLVNFIHELTHSIVEESIVKIHQLDQADKERIVDYLVLKILPDAGYHRFGAPSEELLKRVGLK